ncbi:MAG: UGMP family protein, partial [Nanoarchaeota archaeon]
PLIPVNHLIAHLEIGKLFTYAKDPVFILATGANTQIIAFEAGRYRIFGETLDIGIGNALDKFGRAINLGFPAGPKIEQLAKYGKYVELPYVVKGMDLSFSGILTRAIELYKHGVDREDLCYSLQETYFSMLTEVTERAMAHINKKEALLIGGVAANKRLIEMLNIMCKERKAKFYFVPIKYSGDQAAMIAWNAILQYKSNKKYYDKLKLEKIDINPNWRVEDVEINWV